MKVSDSVFLVTGGTGSFGSAVVKRLLAEGAAEIRIFSRDEKKQDDFRTTCSDSRLKFIIGDVRDRDSITQSMRGVNHVFHAAALKQVPSCEFFPREAALTNVFGAGNVFAAASECGVDSVVALSTDKAVYPVNSMGLTKALMEKFMQAHARSAYDAKTRFCCTRYGNVMGSRGSVIPRFIESIQRGLPLTVTDPKMTRFLMSLDESVDLVLHALHSCQQGDIFVQKAPAATVGDIAFALIEIFDADSEIKIIGTRHGEKLHESLLSREEVSRAVESKNYYQIPLDNRDLSYSNFVTSGEDEISTAQDYTSETTTRLKLCELKKILEQLECVRHGREA